MQHFKVLLVLLFVAAVGISLTKAWTMNSQRIGKRKQIFPFSCRHSLFILEFSKCRCLAQVVTVGCEVFIVAVEAVV